MISALTTTATRAKILDMNNSRRDEPSSTPALTTYIGYITGPRAEQPAGVRVVEPPPNTRQSQRGNLYLVVELFGDHPERASITEQLLSELQQVYYTAKGSQSQVMVDAVHSAQRLLREVNATAARYPLQAGLLCAALLGGKLVVVASGPAFALIHAEGRVHMFPSDPSVGAGGFGNSPVELFRQELQANDALFLAGGSWLSQIQPRVLAGIVAYTTPETCSDAADELFDQAGHAGLPGLLIALAPYSGPPRSGPSFPGTQPPGAGGAPPRSSPPKRPRFGGLPTALSTLPPARLPPTTTDVPPPPAALQPSQEEPDYPGTSTGALPAISDPAPAYQHEAETELFPWSDAALNKPAETVGREDVAEPVTELLPAAASVQPKPEMWEKPEEWTAQPASRQPLDVMPVEGAARTVEGAVLAVPDATAAETEIRRAAARKAEISNPLLPTEPGNEVGPLFPGDADLEAESQPRAPDWRVRAAQAAGGGWQATKAFFARMLPVRDVESTERELDEKSPTTWAAPPEVEVRMVAASLPAATAVAPSRVAESSSRTLPEPLSVEQGDVVWPDAPTSDRLTLSPPYFNAPPRTDGPRARLLIAVSLLILILVPATVLAFVWGQSNTRLIEAEQLTAEAEIMLVVAQGALDEGDRVQARELLTEAAGKLDAAYDLDGMNAQRATLYATIEAEMQEVLQVTPLYGLTTPLLTFPAEARPRKVVVFDEDIYLLDNGRQAVVQYRYDPATRTADEQQGQVILRQGDVVEGVVVGSPADMVYLLLQPGVVDRPSLLILDRNNNVFRYDPRVAGVTRYPLAGSAEWGSIARIQTYNGLIYLADETRNQILRFSPALPNEPGMGWFASQTQVNLAGLVSMQIDGDIWLLFSNGMILRYRSGEQVPFSPENSIVLAEEAGDMVVTWRESANIYLVDSAQDRILVYDKSGAYLQQLRAPEEKILRGLVGIFVDEGSGIMFLLTQSGLFTHPLPQ